MSAPPRGLTREQASDWLAEHYGGIWCSADPEWWEDMIEMLMESAAGPEGEPK